MSEFSDAELPVAAGTVRGIRAWYMSSVHERAFTWDVRTMPDALVKLTGMYGWDWPAGTAWNQADCARFLPGNTHRAPASTCGCGFWAYWRAGEPGQITNIRDFAIVTGVIEGAGKVIIGTKGFRCERARILALAVTRVQMHSSAGWHRVVTLGSGEVRRVPDMLPEELMAVLTEKWRVPVFGSQAEMVAEFPLTDSYLPDAAGKKGPENHDRPYLIRGYLPGGRQVTFSARGNPGLAISAGSASASGSAAGPGRSPASSRIARVWQRLWQRHRDGS